MNYTFHPAAEAEHLENIRYYESVQAGLGARYLGEFESAMQTVCTNPLRYATTEQESIRRMHLKAFPFTIFFRVHNGETQVLAVAHYRRHPAYWLKRPAQKADKDSQ